jgi:hypothetical protein
MVMALIILIPVGLAASRFVLLPRIHDVTTDISDPPQWLEPPAVSSSWMPRSDAEDPAKRRLQAGAYAQVTGRRYEGAIDRVLLAVQAVAQEKKWTPVANVGVEALVDGLEPNPAGNEQPDEAGTSNGEADPARAPLPAPRPDTFAVIQYRARTLVLGIPQDVLVRLSEEEETTFVDMRAATRDGDHDLGLNAELIRAFLQDLDVRLLGIAGG